MKNINVAPVANAGAAQSVNENTKVTLDGSASKDSDGTIAQYAWKQTTGPTVTLTGATTAKPTFTAPIITADTALTFELTAKDNDGATAKDTVVITVKNVLIGRFVDSATSGLAYKTSDYSGVTDANGYFRYTTTGENVYFSVGQLSIGIAQAAPEIHVYDLNGSSLEMQAGKNIRVAQILQSLDKDKNPANNIQLPDDLDKKFDGSFDLNFTQAQTTFDAVLKQKLADWKVGSYVSYEDAKAHADKSAKQLAAKCPLPDPRDANLKPITGLSCVDKARINYFTWRVKPGLHSQMKADFDQTKIISEEYTEEAAKRATDNNPIILQLQAFDALMAADKASSDGNAHVKYGKIAEALLKHVKTLVNTTVYFDGNSDSQGAAARFNKLADFAEKIIDAAANTQACVALWNGKTTDDGSCVTAVSSALTALQKAPGMEDVKFVDKDKFKAAIGLFVSNLGLIKSISDFGKTDTSAKVRSAAWGLAGSFVKVLRSGITAGYASAGEKEGIPSTQAGYLMGSGLDNIVTPFLTIAKNCDGADKTQLLKCYSSISQEVGKQALRTAVAVVGNFQMIKSVSDLNASIVTDKVLEEFLLAGSANQKAVYDKYGIVYGGGETLEFIRLGALIEAIGKKEFGYTGVTGYDPWFVAYWKGFIDRNAFSVEGVRSALFFNYSRVVNEASLEFDSPAIALWASNGVRGETTITAEFDVAEVRVENGSLLCYADDYSDHPSDNPLKRVLYGKLMSYSFNMKFSRSGQRWVMCNLYHANGIYLGSKSIPISVEGYDNDADEMLDTWEIKYDLNPNDPSDAAKDKDRDGLSNLAEYNLGTNPAKADTDGDGYTDKQEVDAGSDPLDKGKYPTLSAPQNLKATPGDGKLTVSWDAVTGAVGYGICRATVSIPDVGKCASYAGGAWTGTTNTQTELSGLVNGTKYYFRVIALDAKGNKSPASTEVTATPKKPSGATGKLNDTGITTCGNATQNNQPCPLLSHPNQDGDSGRDVTANDNSDGHAGFSFTKISSTGAVLPASATQWSCVKDNVTGLMWEIKQGTPNGIYGDTGLHDPDDVFTWYEPDNTKNGGHAGDPAGDVNSLNVNYGKTCYGHNHKLTGTWCNSKAYVERVNTAGWCGAKDWRMPTKRELKSIVSHDRYGPAIDTAWFPNPRNSWFWSSSPVASNGNNAWYVPFYYGDGNWNLKGSNFSVRLVRSGQ